MRSYKGPLVCAGSLVLPTEHAISRFRKRITSELSYWEIVETIRQAVQNANPKRFRFNARGAWVGPVSTGKYQFKVYLGQSVDWDTHEPLLTVLTVVGIEGVTPETFEIKESDDMSAKFELVKDNDKIYVKFLDIPEATLRMAEDIDLSLVRGIIKNAGFLSFFKGESGIARPVDKPAKPVWVHCDKNSLVAVTHMYGIDTLRKLFNEACTEYEVLLAQEKATRFAEEVKDMTGQPTDITVLAAIKLLRSLAPEQVSEVLEHVKGVA